MAKQIIKKTIALSLVVILLTAICAYGTIIIINHFNKNENDLINTPKNDVMDENGNSLESGIVYPMTNNMIFSIPSKLSTTSSNGITISATVYPATATNKAVDWKVEWINPNSSFASGKTVSNYLTVNATSDGALTANVSCLMSFGEKIKIIVISRENTNAKVECIVDYAQRLTSTNVDVVMNNRPEANFSINNINQTLKLFPTIQSQVWYQLYGTEITNKFKYIYESNYTVLNSIISNKIEIKASDELLNALSIEGLTSDCANWFAMEKVNYADIIAALGGRRSILSNDVGGFLQILNYNKLVNAFGKTSKIDFQLKFSTYLEYGGTYETIYNCHFDHSTAGLTVESIQLANSSLTI